LQRMILRQIEAETSAIVNSARGRKRTSARHLARRISAKVRIQDASPPKLSTYLTAVLSSLTAQPRPFNH